MADYFHQSRHDIYLKDPSTGDELGFVCDRVLDAATGIKRPAYSEYDSKYLVDLFATDSPTQVNTNPEEELVLGQSDWRSGLGLKYYDSDDPLRYHKGVNIDPRFRGMIIAGPTPTAIAWPANFTTLAIVNGDMELTTGWTGGARYATVKHGGSYSWRVIDATAYQALAGWHNDYRGTTIKVQCYVYSTAAGVARISVTDGTDTTASSDHTGGGSWEALTVTHRINAAGTKIQLQMTSDTGGSSFDDYTIETQPTLSTMPRRGWAEFNDELYIANGNILLKLNASGDGFTTVNSFLADITCLEPFTDSKLYICLGTSNAYYEMSTGEAFTLNTLANNTMDYMATVHTTASTMYANDGTNTIRSTTNPADGGTAWSAQTTVGASYHSIQDLLSQAGALYIPKEDMVYYLDSSGNVQNDAAPELEALKCSTSGQNCDIWLNKLYYPAGDQALLEISSSNTWITPAEYCTDVAEFNGRVQAVTHDDQWLYAIIDYSTEIEVITGRYETIDSTTSWIWHGSLAEITLAGCQAAWVSTVYKKRLWIASTDSSDSLYYIDLYTGYGNVTSDANRKFKTGGTIDFCYLHGGFKSDQKAWIKLTLTMGHAYNAGRYFTAKYKKLGDTSWTSITGNFDGSATSMVESKYISTTSSTINSTMMQFQLTAVTDDTDYTPVLLDYKVESLLKGNIKRLIFATVRVGHGVIEKAGHVKQDYYELQKTCLANCRDANGLITMKEYVTDKDGSTRYVKMLPLPRNIPWREPAGDREGGKNTELVYNLLMLEQELS